jgi:hypothetical protein
MGNAPLAKIFTNGYWTLGGGDTLSLGDQETEIAHCLGRSSERWIFVSDGVAD